MAEAWEAKNAFGFFRAVDTVIEELKQERNRKAKNQTDNRSKDDVLLFLGSNWDGWEQCTLNWLDVCADGLESEANFCPLYKTDASDE